MKQSPDPLVQTACTELPHAERIVGQCYFFLCTLILLLLVACGGGGGSRSTTPPQPLQQPPQPFPRGAHDNRVSSVPDAADFPARKREFESSNEYFVEWGRQISGAFVPLGIDAHLRLIDAAAAYARGATGAGETIVIMDSGLRETHEEFTHTDPATEHASDAPVTITKQTQVGYVPTDAQKLHGTLVASLAVARRNDGNMQGVAYNADLHFIEVPLESGDPGPPGYSPINLREFNAAADREAANFVGRGVTDGLGDIIGYSFGVEGAITEYSEQLVRERLPRTAAVLAQAGTHDADKKIIVWPTGNAFNDRYAIIPDDDYPDGEPVRADAPELLAGLGAYFPELQTHNIAIAALNEGGFIASYSNRCGIAKSFCIAAPGNGMFAAHSSADDAYDAPYQGTSLAVPMVSGALALLRQFFRNPDGTRQLGNTELVDRLLATANRGGIYADADIYGHGLLDLDAATAPVGAMMSGLPGDPGSRIFSQAIVELSGGAFGAGLSETLGTARMVAFDELGAPFPVSLAGHIRRPARSDHLPQAPRVRQAAVQFRPGMFANLEVVPGLDRQTDELRLSFSPGLIPGRDPRGDADWWLSWGHHDGLSLGLYRDSSADYFLNRSSFAAPWLALVRDGPGFGAAAPLPSGGHMAFAVMRGTAREDGYERTDGDAGTGVIIDYQPGDHPLSLQTGFVREADGFLGTRPRGAFGMASGMTFFTGFNHRWALNSDWHVLSSGYFGWTRPKLHRSGLLRGASRLHSSAFSLGLERRSWWRTNDWMGVRLSQPLHVNSGTADLRLATGRTRFGEVLYQNQRINLKPTGRNLRAEAAWRGPFAAGDLFVSLGLERHADQNAGQGIQFSGAIQFRRSF